MKDIKIVQLETVKRPAPFRGALKSSQYNDTQEEMVVDLTNLTNAVNTLNSRLSRTTTVLQNENQYLRRQVDALRQQQTYAEKIAAKNSLNISRLVDFSNTEGIYFPNKLDDTNSAMLNAEFGEITLPATTIENKFYVNSITTGKIIPPANLSVSVRGTFDKGEGAGLVNYERGGRVDPGRPEWAFNGMNDRFWVRRVEFPIDSRVDQVECELTVVVPEGTSQEVNTLEVIPFPNGSVDVLELATASDLGDNFIRASSFSPTDNLVARKYHLAPTTTDQIKVRLRQRNWVEENGKKVFYYGLQELGAKLIDYDKSYTQGAAFGTNNSFFVKVPAPAGYEFTSIVRIDPTPNFLLEDPSQRHVHLKIGTNSDPSLGLLWSSDSNYTPQSSDPIFTAANNLYLFVELNYVDTSGGVLSPYPVGTTPYVKGIGLSFTLTED